MQRYISVFRTYLERNNLFLPQPAFMRHYSRWRKTTPKVMNEDELNLLVDEYIRQNLPTENDVVLPCENEIGYTKLLKKTKIPYRDTLVGICVEHSIYDKLQELLHKLQPVYPHYEAICTEIGIEPSMRMYNQFVFQTSALTVLPYHPNFSSFSEFFGDDLDIKTLILHWFLKRGIALPATVKGYVSVADAAKLCDTTVQNMLAWLSKHPENCINTSASQLLVSQDTINELCNYKKRLVPLKPIITQCLSTFTGPCKANARIQIRQALSNSDRYPWLITEPDIPGVSKKSQYCLAEMVDQANSSIRKFLDKLPSRNLVTLSGITKLTKKELVAKVQSGYIVAEEINGTYYLSANEYNTVCAIVASYIPLEDIVATLLTTIQSKFSLSVTQDRANFLKFCEDTGIAQYYEESVADFPLNSKRLQIIVAQDCADDISSRCKLWLMGYKLSYKAKYNLILSHFAHKYPQTVHLLKKYVPRLGCEEINRPIVDMVDTLFYCLNKVVKELTILSEKEIEIYIIREFRAQTITSATLLAKFLYRSHITNKVYKFDKTGYTYDVSAYALSDYAVMVAAVTNIEIWNECNLIEKALESETYASLWLYIALHAFSAQRYTDLARLEPPALLFSAEETLERIRNGTYTDEHALYVEAYFEQRFACLGLCPHKTESSSGITPLYFFCPEDCRVAFGFILSIAAAHQIISGNPIFVSQSNKISHIRAFFGDIFASACGNINFSGRRANKALMQSLTYSVQYDDNASPYVAYSIASLVRSHKRGYGTLADSTDIYLRDANFSGYTPEYIASQMLARGVCSFAVDLLLERCYGDQYKSLSVCAKTDVIQSIGLSPYQLDNLMRAVNSAKSEAIKATKELAASADSKKIEQALIAITNGKAVGKTPGQQCLCRALGMACKFPSRRGCLGCLYEIKSKMLFASYVDNYWRLYATTSTPENDFDQAKSSHLLKTVVIPAIAEIVEKLKENTSHEEFMAYADFMKERKEYYESNCQSEM